MAFLRRAVILVSLYAAAASASCRPKQPINSQTLQADIETEKWETNSCYLRYFAAYDCHFE
jgi:hypothetical protein